MSTATSNSYSTTSDDSFDDELDYRALHTGALLGLLIAIVSLVFPFGVASFADISNAAVLGIVPAFALVLSAWAAVTIRSNRELYTGATTATIAVLIAGASLVGGAGYGAYVYATEVPDGYTRTSFLQMKPDEIEMAGRQAVPTEIQGLLGKKVFIKGFIRPDSTNSGLRQGISEFLLVRDNQQCCFGDLSKVDFYDQVAVDLAVGLTTDYSPGVFRCGGELGVRPGNVAGGEPPLVYTLDADYVK
ncbi:MAG: hypothetical protein AAGB00_02645 [Planctomycetota bacterium]